MSIFPIYITRGAFRNTITCSKSLLLSGQLGFNVKLLRRTAFRILGLVAALVGVGVGVGLGLVAA